MIDMRTRRRVAGLLALVGLLAACSSTTSGSGQATSSGASGSSAPDFPSGTASPGAPSTGAGSGTGPTASSGGSSPVGPPTAATPAHRVPSSPLRTATVQGSHATYVIKVWADVRTTGCADHAYGTPVISYLTKHPCHGLDRLLATTTVNGRAVGFAQSSLGFQGNAPKVYQTAGDFETLVTKDGTGNIADLMREGYRLPSGPAKVPYPDAFKALGQDSGVVIVDAWYLAGSTPDGDPALETMAEEIFLQF